MENRRCDLHPFYPRKHCWHCYEFEATDASVNNVCADAAVLIPAKGMPVDTIIRGNIQMQGDEPGGSRLCRMLRLIID